MGAPETKTEGRRPALSSVCVLSYLLPHDLLQTYLDEVVNCLMLEKYFENQRCAYTMRGIKSSDCNIPHEN